MGRKYSAYRSKLFAPPVSPQDYSLKPLVDTHSIFVHIPKCAGLSVAQALYGCYGPGHLQMRAYQLHFDEHKFNSMFKFTFVRNPWDRLLSAYYFLRKGGLGNTTDTAFNEKILSNYPTFEHFVMHGLTDSHVLSYYHFAPQINFLKGYRGDTPIDFVGRFENIEKDFHTIAENVKSGAKLPKFNVNILRPNKNYQDAYTDAMRARAAQFYATDIQAFGYQFAPTYN